MYEQFFQMTERPFSKTPDPRFLFLSHCHREGLARMQYAVEERDMILLTGQVGCGKTTLSRALMDILDDRYHVVCLINPRLTPFEFLTSLSRHMDVEMTSSSKADVLEQLGKKLLDFYQSGVLPVLVIDEAHLIPYKETFDEIRLLTNFQMDESNLISIILMGQPELKNRLQHKAYEALQQRIGIQFELKPLSLDETAEYLEFRVTKAGGASGTFSRQAIECIYQYSGGIPRMINHAASLALLECFGRESRLVDQSVINSVMLELNN